MNNKRGYKLSSETVERMKLNRVGMKGKNHSEKTKKKLSYHFKKIAYDLLRRRSLTKDEIERIKRKLVTKNDYIRIKESRSRKGYNKHNNAVCVSHERIMKEVAKLEKQGFKCIPITEVIPDIIAIKNNKVHAIEVEYGKPDYDKYLKNNYYKRFHKIDWIIKK